MLTDPNLSDTDYELLSAYIDGVLSDSERSVLEARLNSEPALVRELNALRQTVALINQLPAMKAPRDFTLTAQMVGIRLVDKPRRPLIFPVLQFASAAAAMVMILFAVGLFLSAGNDSQQFASDANVAAAPSATMTSELGVAFTNAGELSTEERLTAVAVGTLAIGESRSMTADPTMRIPQPSTLLTLTASADENANLAVQQAEVTLTATSFIQTLIVSGTPETVLDTMQGGAGDAGGGDDTFYVEPQTGDEADSDGADDTYSPLPISLPTATPTITPSPVDNPAGNTQMQVEEVPLDEQTDDSATMLYDADAVQVNSPTITATASPTPMPSATLMPIVPPQTNVGGAPMPTQLPPSAVGSVPTVILPLPKTATPVPFPTPTPLSVAEAVEELQIMEATEQPQQEAMTDVSQSREFEETAELTPEPAPQPTDILEIETADDSSGDNTTLLAIILFVGGIGLLVAVFLSWWLPRRNQS